MVDNRKDFSKPIRIAFLDSTAQLGGAEHLLLTLLDGLQSCTAIEPLLVCPHDGPFTEKARQKGIHTEIVELPEMRPLSRIVRSRKVLNPLAVVRNLFSILISAFRMARFLRTQQIDLVQTNSTFSHIYGGLAARFAGLPCIWYFHELVEPQRLKGSLVVVWRVLAATLAARIVGVSQAVVQALSAGTRCQVIYAGQPDIQYRPRPELRARLNLPGDTLLLGYIGRIAYAKGLDILIEAAHKVVQASPQAHFVVMGDALFGESRLKHDLLRHVEELKLTDHWHWLGYDAEATGYLPEFEMLILPSRREALGLVLVEAGAAGKPVVAARIGGVPEVVIDGETGLLVPPCDPAQLANAILQLIDDPVLAQEMGRKAHERIKQLFDLQRYYREFIELYETTLQKPENPVRL